MTKKKKVRVQTKRVRNLTDEDINTILGIIDGWQGKLTYEGLIEACAIPLRHRFSRQALSANVTISEAIRLRKEGLKSGSGAKPVKSVELQKALEKIDRLEAENHRLSITNEALLAQFVRWATNAHNRGLSVEVLNMPLPPVDRNPTHKPPRANGKAS